MVLPSSCQKEIDPEIPNPPKGALSGKFTVNAEGKKVLFSPGNLYYDGNTFNFETNQYDFTPSTDGNWDQTHVSHFYWNSNPDIASALKYSARSSDVFFTNTDGFKVNVDGQGQTGWQTEYPVESTKTFPVTWPKMEDAGAVCLPATGYRFLSNVLQVNEGRYWSSSSVDDNFNAYCVSFFFDNSRGSVVLPAGSDCRYLGFSVRLVTECQ